MRDMGNRILRYIIQQIVLRVKRTYQRTIFRANPNTKRLKRRLRTANRRHHPSKEQTTVDHQYDGNHLLTSSPPAIPRPSATNKATSKSEKFGPAPSVSDTIMRCHRLGLARSLSTHRTMGANAPKQQNSVRDRKTA